MFLNNSVYLFNYFLVTFKYLFQLFFLDDPWTAFTE